jgi:tetratricopeptide (TPR) repeat protein
VERVESFGAEPLDEGEVIEVGEDDIIEAELIQEAPQVEEGYEEVTENLDNEGRLVMLKVDTYVKYGQFKEATNVLSDYTEKNDFITPKERLADLYGELADKMNDPGQYHRLAAQQYLRISQIAQKNGNGRLASSMLARAQELDPSGGAKETISGPSEAAPEFDIVLEEAEEIAAADQEVDFSTVDEMEVSESIDVGEMGGEPIEISLEEEAIAEEEYETVVEDEVLHEVKPTREPQIRGTADSGLINMAPKDEPLSDGEDYFDLRKELEEVVLEEDISLESKGGAGLLGKDDQYSFEDVFDEFKRGVEKQFGKEDFDTHYNLGIAYREMGLFDDAITEFLTSSNDPKKKLDSFIMLGVTYRDIGVFDKSIDYFREAADTPTLKPEERLGILYEQALSHEQFGETDEAYSLFEKIYGRDPSFRDVSEKIKSLRGKTAAPAKDSAPSVKERPPHEDKPTKPAPPKKGKISFV